MEELSTNKTYAALTSRKTKLLMELFFLEERVNRRSICFSRRLAAVGDASQIDEMKLQDEAEEIHKVGDELAERNDELKKIQSGLQEIVAEDEYPDKNKLQQAKKRPRTEVGRLVNSMATSMKPGFDRIDAVVESARAAPQLLEKRRASFIGAPVGEDVYGDDNHYYVIFGVACNVCDTRRKVGYRWETQDAIAREQCVRCFTYFRGTPVPPRVSIASCHCGVGFVRRERRANRGFFCAPELDCAECQKPHGRIHSTSTELVCCMRPNCTRLCVAHMQRFNTNVMRTLEKEVGL